MSLGDRDGGPRCAMYQTDGEMVGCGGADFEELSRQVLNAGHDLRFRARGASMYPMVRDGDVLQVRPVGLGEIELGDIVLYRSPRKGMVVHRVVGVRRDGQECVLSIRGDAAKRPDPSVPESQVMGKIVGIERLGRRIDPDSPLSRYSGALYVHLHPVRWWVYTAIRRAKGGLRRLVRRWATCCEE